MEYPSMRWIYLSPHLDDAAFSCGGLIWEQTQAGLEVQIWTICAGDPPQGSISPFAEALHERWESGADAGPLRRQEDLLACKILGAAGRHMPIPDCIYRRQKETGEHLYASEEALFGELHPSENELVESLADSLRETVLSGSSETVNLVCPFGLGGHVDHQLTRAAAERVSCSAPDWAIWYYADFPYLLEDATLLAELPQQEWHSQVFPVTADGLEAWQRAMAAYRSQVSTFWDGVEDMKASIAAYCGETGGVRLWWREAPTE
jgi:LmbE family N-acetylglucosaminyl deacetylase